MRFKNAMINSVMIVTTQVILTVFSLITRKVFMEYLGVSYLGFDGLFTNIIGVLSIVDLGLVQAMYFSLYKPIHDCDYVRINKLIGFYKKIFSLLGLILIILSLVLVPYLDMFVNGYSLANEMRLAFVLFSLSSFSFYFFVTKRALFFASQENYVLTFVDFLAKVVIRLVQIIALIKFKSYIGYICIDFSCMLFSNIFISLKCNRHFKFLKKEKEKLDASDKKEIIKNVKNVFFSRICGVGVGCTDSLIISKILGVASLGIISNYTLILNSLTGLFSGVYTSIVASFAHLYNDNSKDKIYQKFILSSEIMNVIATIVVVGASACLGDFIPLFFGQKVAVGSNVLIVLILNAYLLLATLPITSQISVVGKFKKNTPVSLAWMLTNLIFSLYLTPKYGLLGVHVGTFISYLVLFILTAMILRVEILNNNLLRYMVMNSKYFIFSFISAILLSSNIFNVFNNHFANLILKGIIATIYIAIFLGGVFWLNLNFRKLVMDIFKLKRGNTNGREQ